MFPIRAWVGLEVLGSSGFLLPTTSQQSPGVYWSSCFFRWGWDSICQRSVPSRLAYHKQAQRWQVVPPYSPG